jgi:single-strand DNA-binding protein
MTDFISLTGLVATTPRHLTTSEGLAITSFRLASSQRRYDRATQKWVDGDTNWYTVSAFRGLASNAASSISKGERVIVNGRLRIRDWENTDRSGTTVEIEADSFGHDLTWGTSVYTRTPSVAIDSALEEDGWASVDVCPEDDDAPIAAKARKAA